MPVVAANGIQINYTDSGGQGPAVVFSHGYLMDHTMFDRQVAALAPRYRVITWLERGPGPVQEVVASIILGPGQWDDWYAEWNEQYAQWAPDDLGQLTWLFRRAGHVRRRRGAPHASNVTRPDELNRAVLGYLAGLDGE